MPLILGKDGVNREQKEIYLGIGGVNKKQKEIYLGVGGVNKKTYNSSILPIYIDRLENNNVGSANVFDFSLNNEPIKEISFVSNFIVPNYSTINDTQYIECTEISFGDIYMTDTCQLFSDNRTSWTHIYRFISFALEGVNYDAYNINNAVFSQSICAKKLISLHIDSNGIILFADDLSSPIYYTDISNKLYNYVSVSLASTTKTFITDFNIS